MAKLLAPLKLQFAQRPSGASHVCVRFSSGTADDMLVANISVPSYASEMRSFGPSMVKTVRLFWKSRFVFVQFPVAPSVNAQLQAEFPLM